MIKYVNNEIKHMVPENMKTRTPDLPCGGSILLHIEDCNESFSDLIKFGKISPTNEVTVHSYQYERIGDDQGTCHWLSFVSSSRCLVGCSHRRDEVSSYESTVADAVSPFLQKDRPILGSETKRLETPSEFIKEWNKISRRCIEEKSAQQYINVPVVTEETDSAVSKILVKWSGTGLMTGVNALGLRADGLNSTYWYLVMEIGGNVQSTVFGGHFGMHVLCLWVFVCLCGAIFRRYVRVFRKLSS